MIWIVLLLVTGVVALWRVGRSLQRIADQLEQIHHELHTLRGSSRARIGTLAAHGMTEEGRAELALHRLGRDSRAKRVVVGGDPDSEQSHMLGKRSEED